MNEERANFRSIHCPIGNDTVIVIHLDIRLAQPRKTLLIIFKWKKLELLIFILEFSQFRSSIYIQNRWTIALGKESYLHIPHSFHHLHSLRAQITETDGNLQVRAAWAANRRRYSSGRVMASASGAISGTMARA